MKKLIIALLLLAGTAYAGDSFRVLRPTETVTVTSSQGTSSQLGQNYRWIYVWCSATCWIGSAATNTAAASAASNAVLLPSFSPQIVGVSASGYVLTLRDTSNGNAYITPIEPR